MNFRFPYHSTCGGHHVDNSPALLAEGVTVQYPMADRPALDHLSLVLERGSFAALLGHNGSGKSTLLKAASGLVPISKGRMNLLGHAVGACHHQVAYLPQHQDIDWDFPVCLERLVLSGCYVHQGWLRRPGRAEREKLKKVLRLLGLHELARRQLHELSGGQQQRALLARTLLHEADVLLLDEPLNAVDRETKDIVLDVLLNLHREGKTILLATHDTFGLDASFSQVFRLNNGSLLQPETGGNED